MPQESIQRQVYMYLYYLYYMQFGGGKCSLCGSSGTNKTTCPMNPNVSNPNEHTHPLAKAKIVHNNTNVIPNSAVIPKPMELVSSEDESMKYYSAYLQVVRHLTFFQLLKARQINKMMKSVVDEEIIHRHNVKFGQNSKSMNQRIHDLQLELIKPAKFHYGIYMIARSYVPFISDFDDVVDADGKKQVTPEIYDEMNIALNRYLRNIIMEIDNGGTINSAVFKMFSTSDSKKAQKMIIDMNEAQFRAVKEGLKPGAYGDGHAWNSVADIRYRNTPVYLNNGDPYYAHEFFHTQIDPKEIQRVLAPFYIQFSDSDIIYLAVALSTICSKIMSAGVFLKKFSKREHVKEAAAMLFNTP